MADDTKSSRPMLNGPHLLLDSAAGLASTTAEDTHVASAQHITTTSAGDTSASANRSWLVVAKEAIRTFVHEAGMKLIAASGRLELTAQKDELVLLAQKDVLITSTSGELRITSPKRVLLVGGGSFIDTHAGGIEMGSRGAVLDHAASHDISPGKNNPVGQINMPTARLKEPQENPGVLVFLLHSHGGSGVPVANMPYALYKDQTLVKRGITDEQGQVLIEKHQSGTKAYRVETANGNVYHLDVHKAYAEQAQKAQVQKLSAQGHRATNHDDAKRHPPQRTI